MVMEYNQYKKYITILATKFVIFIYWLHYISKLIRYVFFQLFPSVPFCHLEFNYFDKYCPGLLHYTCTYKCGTLFSVFRFLVNSNVISLF